MGTRYRITIEEMGQEKTIVGSQWKPMQDTEKGYGYTPEVEATRDYSRTIYEQTVEDLEMDEVIRAVNHL